MLFLSTLFNFNDFQILISVLVFIFRIIFAVGSIILVGLQFCCSEELKCEFQDQAFVITDTLYSCFVNSLVIQDNSMIITNHTGVHKTNKIDKDVKAIIIEDTNLKFIPKNLGLLFNLTVLYMYETHLVEIKSIDFHGMQELKVLQLYENKLSSLPVDVFSTLKELRFISLGMNLIEELPKGLFDNNLNLEVIDLWHNQIKFVGSGLLDNLLKLSFIDMDGNVCVQNRYRGITAITQLKYDIEINCKTPTTTTMTTN